jgi:hypothetical protein
VCNLRAYNRHQWWMINILNPESFQTRPENCRIPQSLYFALWSFLRKNSPQLDKRGCSTRNHLLPGMIGGLHVLTVIHEQLLEPDLEEEHGSIAANPAAIAYPCRS